MFYFLKKIFGILSSPFSLALMPILIGGVLLHFSAAAGRYRRAFKIAGRISFGFGLLALFIFSNSGVNAWMTLRYERRYASQPEFVEGVVPASSRLAACRYVLVLGSGSDPVHEGSSLSRLPVLAQLRLAEGVRIARALPEARLVVSGGGMPNFPTAAQESETAAVSLGFPRERILRFDDTADTRAEIKAVKAISGGSPIALVTTAFHLPRAMKLCAELGVEAVPCPAGYTFGSSLSGWDFFLWQPLNLFTSAPWFHEVLGSLFA